MTDPREAHGALDYLETRAPSGSDAVKILRDLINDVELLKLANINYSGANAGLLGRVMAAESKLNHVHSCIDVLQARTDGTLGRAETGREKATLDTLVHVIGECLINARAAAPPHPSEPAARADASAQREQ